MENLALIAKAALIAIPILLAIAAITVSVADASFARAGRAKIDRLFNDRGEQARDVITEADIEKLPEPVQRYMRYTGVIDRKRISSVRLKQKGSIRMKPDGQWLPLRAEEYYAVEPPGFIWLGKVKMAPLTTVTAQDMYIGGKGSMQVKLLSTINVVDATGKEMDEAALMRYFSEMIWFPTGLLGRNVKWEPIDSRSARASLTDSGMTVSAVFFFDGEGRLTNITAERGRDIGGGTLVKTKWSTPMTEYKTFDGLRLPSKGEAIWHLDSGEYSYIQLELTEVEFDKPSVF